MTMAAAADWIDEHLPIPPNVDNLTGGGPLPSRPGSPPPPIETPPTLALSPAETKSSFRASSSSEERSIEGVSPSTSDSSCSSRKKQRDASLGKPLVCLHLAPLPDRSTPETLVTLFTGIGVQVSSPRARERSASAARLFGFVDVAWSDAEYCIECLDLKPVADVTLRCLKARSVDRGLDPGTHPVPFNRTPHGGLTILEVTGVPLHLCVQDIRQLFAAIDVKALSVERARTDGDGGDTSYAVEISAGDVRHCLEAFDGDGVCVGDQKLSCTIRSVKTVRIVERSPRSPGAHQGDRARQRVSSARDLPTHLTTLQLLDVPSGILESDLMRIFDSMSVTAYHLTLLPANRYRPATVFYDVDTEASTRCLRLMHGYRVLGGQIGCQRARTQSSHARASQWSRFHNPTNATNATRSQRPGDSPTSTVRAPSRSPVPSSRDTLRHFHFDSGSHYSSRFRSRSPSRSSSRRPQQGSVSRSTSSSPRRSQHLESSHRGVP